MGRSGTRSNDGQRRRDELKRLRNEALYDWEWAEAVSLHDYPALDVRRAEVCHDSTGYCHPGLDEDRSWRARRLRAQQIGALLGDWEDENQDDRPFSQIQDGED